MMRKTLSLVLALTLLLSLALPAAAKGEYIVSDGADLLNAEVTVLADQPDRKIQYKGLGADGNFPSNPVIPGESPVTGLPWEGRYMPMLAQIDNYNGGIGTAAPWGAAQADIIYETPINAPGATRLTFLFSDDLPEAAGPIRSARVGHAELREEWDGGFIYTGVQMAEGTNVEDIFKANKTNRKGVLFRILNGGSAKYQQYTSWLTKAESGTVPPHNVSVNVKMLQTFVPETTIAPDRPFLFTDDLPTEGDSAREINILQRSQGYRSTFRYDEVSNSYFRFVEGEPYIDKYTEEQLAFSNLIIQRTRVFYFNGEGDRPVTVNIGSGNADIFMGGRYIPGYWVRTGIDQRTVFFDQYGNEIALQRGSTFICVFSDAHEVNYR